MKKMQKVLVTLMIVCSCMFIFSTSVFAAYSYDTKSHVKFTNVILPDECGNVTFATTRNGKTTDRNYGKVRITSYSYCDTIDCWLRTRVDGSWHYWTDYILLDISDTKFHKIRYCNRRSTFYAKGVKAELRGENADVRWAIINDAKVSGNVFFN
ncbi:MAG: hypothetical protein ACI4EF_11850 [Coprococcus sp.]